MLPNIGKGRGPGGRLCETLFKKHFKMRSTATVTTSKSSHDAVISLDQYLIPSQQKANVSSRNFHVFLRFYVRTKQLQTFTLPTHHLKMQESVGYAGWRFFATDVLQSRWKSSVVCLQLVIIAFSLYKLKTFQVQSQASC